MDSDHAIDATNARKLRDVASTPSNAKVVSLVVSVHCPGGRIEDEADMAVVQRVKLFSNYPQIRSDGRIHAQVISSVRALDGDIAWTDRPRY
jgi:hypothetical protein